MCYLQLSHRGNHFSASVYLNNYNIDFKGGRFIFTDQQVNRTVEPRKGRVLIYTSGPENRNYIEKVTSGTRYAINIPFTCNKDFALEEPSLSKNTLWFHSPDYLLCILKFRTCYYLIFQLFLLFSLVNVQTFQLFLFRWITVITI